MRLEMFVTKIVDIKCCKFGQGQAPTECRDIYSSENVTSYPSRLNSQTGESKVQNARSLGILKNMDWGDLCSRLGYTQ